MDWVHRTVQWIHLRPADQMRRKRLTEGLPPVTLRGAGIECWAGLLAIDASGLMIAEAGEDVVGNDYVSVIAFAKDFPEKQRRLIAKRAMELWQKFADASE